MRKEENENTYQSRRKEEAVHCKCATSDPSGGQKNTSAVKAGAAFVFSMLSLRTILCGQTESVCLGLCASNSLYSTADKAKDSQSFD